MSNQKYFILDNGRLVTNILNPKLKAKGIHYYEPDYVHVFIEFMAENELIEMPAKIYYKATQLELWYEERMFDFDEEILKGFIEIAYKHTIEEAMTSYMAYPMLIHKLN